MKFKIKLIILFIVILIIAFKSINLYRYSLADDLIDAILSNDTTMVALVLSNPFTDISYSYNANEILYPGTGIVGATPLEYSLSEINTSSITYSPNIEMFSYLLRNGAIPTDNSPEKEKILSIIVTNTDVEFLDTIMQYYESIDDFSDLLFYALQNKSHSDNLIRALVSRYNVPIEAHSLTNEHPLETSISLENASITEFLLSMGVSPNTLSKNKTPVIFNTLFSGENYQILEPLLSYGADPNSQIKLNENNSRSLIFYINDFDSFKNLVSLGVSIHQVDSETGENFLFGQSNTDILSFLLDNNLDINHQNLKGENPIECIEKIIFHHEDLISRYSGTAKEEVYRQEKKIWENAYTLLSKRKNQPL